MTTVSFVNTSFLKESLKDTHMKMSNALPKTERSDYLQITNPKIATFYAANPHISFNDVNLKLIEIIESATFSQITTTAQLESAFFRPEKKRQIDELTVFTEKMREAIEQQIHYISTQYISAKSEYANEFTTNPYVKSQLSQMNSAFLEKTKSMLFAVSKLRHANIAEKAAALIRQFEKILNANAESIVSKPETDATTKEYIDNFESNASIMIQAIIQLLTECLTANELRVKNLMELLQKGEEVNSSFYYKLIYDLNDILHQIPPLKQGVTSHTFEYALSHTFPTASILNVDEQNKEFVLSRSENPTIYIESHDMRDRNATAAEVKRFISQTGDKSTHGIFISQYTGISGKSNYQVEIHNNRVIVYLHKLEFSGEKLKIAVDMIDALTSKLTDFFFSSENKYSIPKDVLDDVNREYQQFIVQKESLLSVIKEQHKRVVSQIDEMRFISLDKYLSTRYSSCKKQGFTCDLCNLFNVGTLKGLAAHKRGCARKQQQVIEPMVLLCK